MKKLAGIVGVVILVGVTAIADDGGVRFPTDWRPGQIYVEEENPSVRLDKEILNLRAGKTGYVSAIFKFVNKSPRSEIVLSGFPVELKIPFYTTEQGFGVGGGNALFNPDVMSLLVDDNGYPLFVEDSDPEKFGYFPQYIGSVVDFENGFRVLYFDELFEQPMSDDGLGLLQSIQITQDQVDVAIDQIIIESRIETLPNPEQDVDGWISLTLHFIHTLVFPADRPSIVEVSYDLPSIRHEGKGASYEVNYILGTGATWEGSIGRLLISSPNNIVLSDDPHALNDSNLTSSSTRLLDFITVENYEPGASAMVRASYDSYGGWGYWDSAELITPRKEDAERAPDSPCGIVANVAASSFYGGSIAVLERKSYVLSTYGPVASFDCVGTNAWVEGVPGNGIGEWIEFDLIRPAYGPFLTNGLRMININKYNFEYEINLAEAEQEHLESIWGRNNRVRELSLQMIEPGGPVKSLGTIQLLDRAPNAGDRQFLLRPGRYRLTIESVYSGTEWDDTCLGEIEFQEVDSVLIDWYENDPFFTPFIAAWLE